jgi:hypothetical protein
MQRTAAFFEEPVKIVLSYSCDSVAVNPYLAGGDLFQDVPQLRSFL